MTPITLRSKYKTVHDLSHADLYHHRAPTLLQPHRILLLVFPRLPPGLYMTYLFSRGKHPFTPHTFAWLTPSRLFKWMSLLSERRPDCHALPLSLVWCPSCQHSQALVLITSDIRTVTSYLLTSFPTAL